MTWGKSFPMIGRKPGFGPGREEGDDCALAVTRTALVLTSSAKVTPMASAVFWLMTVVNTSTTLAGTSETAVPFKILSAISAEMAPISVSLMEMVANAPEATMPAEEPYTGILASRAIWEICGMADWITLSFGQKMASTLPTRDCAACCTSEELDTTFSTYLMPFASIYSLAWLMVVTALISPVVYKRP